MNETLVIFAIEDTLSKMGESILEQVYAKLYSKHQCLLSDCYENPEYLNSVLKDLFGNSYKEIINSIEKNLEDFAAQEPIKNFLIKLKRP